MASEQQLAFAIKAVNEASKQLQDVQRDIGDLDQKAGAASSGGLTRFGGALKTAGLAAAGLGIAAAGAAAAFGVQSVRKFAQAGDEIHKMAIRTGFSAETLSELRHAAALSGTDLQTLERGVARMQRTLGDASEGTGAAVDALGKLGLKYEDLAGLNPEQQFETIAARLADMEDPTLRAATAQEIFGRSGTNLLPMLADGSEGLAAMRKEAHDLGIVMDEDAAASAAEFNDNMERVRGAVTRAQFALANALVPALNDAAVWLGPKLQAAVSTVQGWARDLDRWLNGNSESARAVRDALRDAEAGFRAIPGAISAVVGVVQNVIDVLAFLTNDFRLLKSTVGPIVRFIAEDIKRNIQIVVDILQIVARLLQGDFSGAWDEVQQLVGRVIDGIVARFELARDLITGVVENVAAVLRDIFGGAVGELVGTVQSGVDEVVGFFESLDNRILGFFQAISSAAKTVGRGIFDGLVGGIRDAVGALVKAASIGADIGKAIANGIIDALNAGIQVINDFIPDKIGIPGPIPDIDLPDDPIPKIPHLARGGIVTRPTLALIGEEGPEAVVPLSGRRGASVGGVHLHIHGNVLGMTVDEMIRAFDRGLKRMGQSGLVA